MKVITFGNTSRPTLEKDIQRFFDTNAINMITLQYSVTYSEYLQSAFYSAIIIYTKL